MAAGIWVTFGRFRNLGLDNLTSMDPPESMATRLAELMRTHTGILPELDFLVALCFA